MVFISPRSLFKAVEEKADEEVGDRLLVGLNTGSLRIYRVNEIRRNRMGMPKQTTSLPRGPVPPLPRNRPIFYRRWRISQLGLSNSWIF
jgi:hypothetical protein